MEIDANTLNATLLKFRAEYPAAMLDRDIALALLGAYESVRGTGQPGALDYLGVPYED